MRVLQRPYGLSDLETSLAQGSMASAWANHLCTALGFDLPLGEATILGPWWLKDAEWIEKLIHDLSEHPSSQELRRCGYYLRTHWFPNVVKTCVHQRLDMEHVPETYRATYWKHVVHQTLSLKDTMHPYILEQSARYAWCWDLALWLSVAGNMTQQTKELLRHPHTPGSALLKHALNAYDREWMPPAWENVVEKYPDWYTSVGAAIAAYDALHDQHDLDDDYRYQDIARAMAQQSTDVYLSIPAITQDPWSTSS